MKPITTTLALSLMIFASTPCLANGEKVIPLWPKDAPGEKGDLGPEQDTTKPRDGLVAGKPVIRLGNVSQPTIAIYPAPKENDTGCAVLVCPGGAYQILAMDLEGTEVCDWLNSIGVTGFLLKYRVPARKGQEKYLAPLQDAQRAMGLIRSRAREWQIDPKRLGILGFSAGGNLAAIASTRYEKRDYDAIDDADRESCRPDFSVLIYPAYLAVKGEENNLAPPLNVTSNAPPTFLVQTQDDGVGVMNSITYAGALQKAKVPFELHIFPTGGHGYGLRRTNKPVTQWPQSVETWMKQSRLLQKRE